MPLLLYIKVVWLDRYHGKHKLKRLLKMKVMSSGERYRIEGQKELRCTYESLFFFQAVEKTQQHNINRTDAIFEVYTDRIVEKTKSCDKGLLWIVSQDISEFSVCVCSAYTVFDWCYSRLNCL